MEDFKPSIERVFRDLEGFGYETKMYVYHKLNGRDEEAETYLNTYKQEQKQMMEELVPMIPKVENLQEEPVIPRVEYLLDENDLFDKK
jgi:hypothetical protein